MENPNSYNGWTNYQTWVYKLWIDNEQEYWGEQAQNAIDNCSSEYDWQTDRDAAISSLINNLESDSDEKLEAFMPSQSCAFADIMNNSIDAINWYEIAESLIDSVE